LGGPDFWGFAFLSLTCPALFSLGGAFYCGSLSPRVCRFIGNRPVIGGIEQPCPILFDLNAKCFEHRLRAGNRDRAGDARKRARCGNSSALKAADDGEPALGVAGVSILLCPGEFNRSTQHYSPKLSAVGLKQFLH
jgi:hypothetical protein